MRFNFSYKNRPINHHKSTAKRPVGHRIHRLHLPLTSTEYVLSGGMTSSTALKLEHYLDMPADFWLKLQMRWDLYITREKEQSILQAIPAYAEMAAD